MDDTAFLHERIQSYADYTNDDDRRRSDAQIRAYVGEALAALYERLHPGGADGEALDRLLFRCEFVDQGVAHAFDNADVDAAEILATAAADRELVTLADRADSIDAGALGAYLAHIDAAFDRRWKRAGEDPVAAKNLPPAR
jgi:hypothetical protein